MSFYIFLILSNFLARVKFKFLRITVICQIVVNKCISFVVFELLRAPNPNQ
jgi:hypothetical protein